MTKPLRLYKGCESATFAVLRALGIPTRVVTAYDAAHESDSAISVDCHVDSTGKPLKDINLDSVWWVVHFDVYFVLNNCAEIVVRFVMLGAKIVGSVVASKMLEVCTQFLHISGSTSECANSV